MRIRCGFVALVLAAAACGGTETSSAPAAAEESHAEAVPAAAHPERHERHERPLPAFSGWTLDHQRVAISSLLGKRLLLFFFNPEVPQSAAVAQAVAAVAPLGGEYNFEIVGVAVGSNRNRAKAFVQEHALDFTVLDDSDAAIAGRLGLRAPLAMLGVDAKGFLKFGMLQFAEDAPAVEGEIREALRLPAAGSAGAAAAEPPLAPSFSARVLDADEPFDLAAQRGRSVVLSFFLHTCPHCHDLLRFMKETLPTLPEDRRPVFVGVEVSGKTYAVRAQLLELGLDFFPVLFDEDESIRRAYGIFAGVPDTFLIDAEGRIRGRVRGWRTEQDPPLLRMRLARLVGAPVPMLLRATGYSGNEVCGVCHESQHETWQFTSHASAYGTLVKHGADSDAECVSCHVVGFGEPGGFEIGNAVAELEDVGCESCHGRGGPHLSPEFVTAGNYQPVCVTCHDTKHSLGFDYASFLPRVSHAANAELTQLSPAARQQALAARGRPGGSLLPTTAAYVGSEACADCHAAEYATWSAGAHARAGQTLRSQRAAGNPDCQRCHTTGFDRSGGFPSGAALDAHPDLSRVGCESCHGPGGDHVPADAAKRGTILSLGDKCDSCVILQICGSCHDEANDPGFEFEVLEKIEKQRHGTIEAGTGRPLGDAAGSAAGDASLMPLLTHALALLERASP